MDSCAEIVPRLVLVNVKSEMQGQVYQYMHFLAVGQSERGAVPNNLLRFVDFVDKKG